MAEITLRFTTSDNWISKLIRDLTDCPFSHVEFVLDEDWGHTGTLGAHLDGGLQLRPIDYTQFARTELATIQCTAEQKHAVIASALACVGEPYDVRDIAGIVFHQDWQQHGHFICSVFVAEKLINNGVPLLRVTDKMPSITPRDVYISPLLTTV